MVKSYKMTKENLIDAIASRTGIEKGTISKIVEDFMESVKESMVIGSNVYLRGFGSFIVKKRARKVARNISKNTVVIIPAHNMPVFKPAPAFNTRIKNVKKGHILLYLDDNKQTRLKKTKGTDDDGPGFKPNKKAKK